MRDYQPTEAVWADEGRLALLVRVVLGRVVHQLGRVARGSAGGGRLPPMAPPSAHPMPAVDDDEEFTEAEHGEAWEAEIDRRVADQRAGRGRAYTLEEVQAHARATFGW